MKTDEKSTLLQIEKEEIKKIIAEVKAIVASIIFLPSEKIISYGTTSLVKAHS
jgi:hypothetical protein